VSIRLSPLFSDGMILQRDTELKIRGFCNPNEFVSVSFAGKTAAVKADENGFWQNTLGKFDADCEPQSLIISSAGETVTIRDVLIGDVWLCSGQSNMELWLSRVCHNYPDEMSVVNPLIRQLKVPQVYNFKAPIDEFGLSECEWKSFSPENAPDFTAAGYFFAKKLYERYKVPIGLLACAVGGTPVSAWMSRDMLKNGGYSDELSEADRCKDDDFIKNTILAEEADTNDYHKRLNDSDEGLNQGWMNADFDDTEGWENVSLFAPLNKRGVYWYRKTLDIPEELWGKKATIFIGTAIDMDEMFISGTGMERPEKIGETYYRYPPREYSFSLPAGKLTIAVRLLVFGNSGGFTKGKNCFIATDSRTIDIGNIGGTWKRRLGTEFESPEPQTFFSYKPTGLYNGMISPLFTTALKGIIWYQGESDTGNPEPYAEKLTAMINGWRKSWGMSLPFLLTQLAYYDDTGNMDTEHLSFWDRLRERQKQCLSLPDTGLAAAYDLGEHNDLHPQNKRDIGERLARLAMRVAYGENLPPNMFEMYNIKNK